MGDMLLIYPPGARSTEPPLGIARLASFLEDAGQEAVCLDLCQEALEYLLGLEADSSAEDTWTRGALKRRGRAMETILDRGSYGSRDRYNRAVHDIERALGALSSPSGAEASLADYRDSRLSPLRAGDLRWSADHFEENLFYPLFEKRIEESLEASVDPWIGLSINFLSQALCAFAIIGYIKARHPRARIAIGGGLVTSWARVSSFDIRRGFEGLIDAAIEGPGEEGLARLFGLEPSLSLPPLFSGFNGLRYFAPTRIIPYNFSWGCPWKNCAFCPEKAEDAPYRGTRAEGAPAALSTLAELYSPGLLHFTDNEVSPLYLAAMAASGLPSRPWYGFARFSRRLLDPSFCAALAASGCVMLQLGLESGDQEVLDAMGKGTRLEEIEAILINLRSASIGTYAYLLFGTPSEDRESALRTRDFVARLAPYIDFLNVAVFNLPSKGPEASSLRTKAFYEGELSLYREFEHPRGWNRSEVRRFIADDFESRPEIRAIASRTPPVFTSNHAPFFLPSGSFPLTPPPSPLNLQGEGPWTSSNSSRRNSYSAPDRGSSPEDT